MKSMTKEQILSDLSHNQSKGYEVTPFIIPMIKNEVESGYSMMIEDQETFLSLIVPYLSQWHIILPHLLFPKSGLTLKQFVHSMRDKKLSFSELAMGKVKGCYSPAWFKTCSKLNTQFDFKKFGTLYLLFANDRELKDSKHGSFRIIEGTHRSLSLAYKIITQNFRFEPIPTVFLTPRSHGWQRFRRSISKSSLQ